MEDLNSKNSVIYEEFEKKFGITKIEDQEDEEFLDTLGLRIKGLEICLENTKNKKEYKYYEDNILEKSKL